MLHKFGARRWIARVMISMGLVSMGFVFVQGAWSLYLMRLLLGIAEAGLFPGIIFYITLWFPKQWRGRVTAAFVAAIPVSSFIAGPLSGPCSSSTGLPVSPAGSGCSSSKPCPPWSSASSRCAT